MIQCVASNPTVKQILREEGCDLRWKPGGVGRNGGQYMWVNLNVDETSRLSGSQPDALYTTGRNVPALLSLTHRLHFLPAQDLYRRCSLGLNALPCSYTPLPSINSHSALRYQLHFHIPPGVWSEEPAPPTMHSENPEPFVHRTHQFSSHLCLHDSVIWLPFLDLSLLTFPIPLTNFSFSWGKRWK